MKKKTTVAAMALPILLAILFCFLPTRTGDVILRLHFWEVHESVQKDGCVLFYTTKDNDTFTAENCVEGYLNETEHRVEFRLDSSLKGQITGIRIDLPAAEQTLVVDDVSVLSGGVVKKNYNPVDFFADEMIKAQNDITAIERIDFQSRAYLVTTGADPYIVLMDGLAEEIASQYTNYTGTRICLAVFLMACCLFAAFPIVKEHTI